MYLRKDYTVQIKVLIRETGKIETLELNLDARKSDALRMLRERGYRTAFPMMLDGWPSGPPEKARDQYDLSVPACEVRGMLTLEEMKLVPRHPNERLYGCPISKELERIELTRTVELVDYA